MDGVRERGAEWTGVTDRRGAGEGRRVDRMINRQERGAEWTGGIDRRGEGEGCRVDRRNR